MFKFTAKHNYLVGIDSDGCAFDSMEIKHKECFIPNFIRVMGLQPVSKFAREACEFANLYSKDRGANRFPAYLKALDWLAQRSEVQDRNFSVPTLAGLRDWVKRETKLSSGTVKAEAERSGDPDVQRASEWSSAVDASVKAMVKNVPPFPGVRESLTKMTGKADLIVCSATPTPALEAEWSEHDIARFVSVICGQEVGSKAEILTATMQRGYDAGKVLMIGDAPGDLKAAKSVGALFYPINPGNEEKSWERFLGEACDRFFAGTYAGDYESQVIAEFQAYLPERPHWVK